MGRKLKLTSLLFGDHHTTTKSPSSPLSPSYSSWAWPSCTHPKTDSLRFDSNVYKTVNSVYFDSTPTTTDSFFTHSSEDYLSDSLSAASDNDDSETVIRGLVRSERLLFEPGGCTSSILEEKATASISSSSTSSRNDDEYGVLVSFSKESVVVAMESEDPYNDFRKSMEEMVTAHHQDYRRDDDDDDHGDDWEWLEELLVWYLRVNGKKNHGYIVGAFVDLLVGLASNYYNCEGEGEGEDEDENISNDQERDASSSSNCMSCISYEIEEEGSGSSS